MKFALVVLIVPIVLQILLAADKLKNYPTGVYERFRNARNKRRARKFWAYTHLQQSHSIPAWVQEALPEAPTSAI